MSQSTEYQNYLGHLSGEYNEKSYYSYTPSVVTPSSTPQPLQKNLKKNLKKRKEPRALVYFARKIHLKEFYRIFESDRDDEVTSEDIVSFFKKYNIYVCDVEFKVNERLSTKDVPVKSAFVYTRRTRERVLIDNISRLNRAIGIDRRRGFGPVARIVGSYRADFNGKNPSNGLYVSSFDLYKDSKKTLEKMFSEFAKGKGKEKKVSIILNTDRFGDPYALVYFTKEHFARGGWKEANERNRNRNRKGGLWIGNHRLSVRYAKKKN